MNEEIKLVFTKKLPTKPGFYWWTNFGEHTPVVLEVARDYNDEGNLWAQNDEFCFRVEKVNIKQIKQENKELDKIDGYYYCEELWCYIPNPWLPNMTKQVEPSCY